MNTSINNLILQWNELKNSANSCINSQNFEPVHLTGLHGSSFAFFLSQLSNSNHFRNLSKSQYEQNYSLNTNSDLLIVVPSEYEANIVYTDISSVFPQAECYVFPWWGTIPYRPVAKGSSVFGKRAGILSKLLHKNKTVNYELLISDIHKIKNMSSKEIARRAIKVQKYFNNGNELVNIYNEEKEILC